MARESLRALGKRSTQRRTFERLCDYADANGLTVKLWGTPSERFVVMLTGGEQTISAASVEPDLLDVAAAAVLAQTL